MPEALALTVLGVLLPVGGAAFVAFTMVGAVALAGRIRGRR